MKYLFRGKTLKGHWKIGYFIESSKENHHVMHSLIVLDENPNGIAGRSYLKVHDKSIGLYSGFTDKKGTRIFEGDIVSMQYGLYKYYVVFENGAFYCYHLHAKDLINGGNLRWGLLSRSFELGENYELEVIGNLFDDGKPN